MHGQSHYNYILVAIKKEKIKKTTTQNYVYTFQK